MNIERISGKIRRYRQIILLVFVSAFSFFIFENLYIFEPLFKEGLGIAAYLTWHTVFEFISILISLCIFILPYYTYKQNHRLRGIFIANVFFTMGMLDLFHTLSYKGMPLFLTPNNDANKATIFWIAARLIGSAGIAAASLIGVKRKSKVDRRFFLAISLLISLGILTTANYFPALFPRMYAEGVGITHIKKVMEYIIILFLLISDISFLREYLRKKEKSSIAFSYAITISIFSELAFVRYSSVYDIYNYVGHLYKFISYFIVFRIAFINNIEKPYSALFKATNKLKAHAGKLKMLVAKSTEELKMKNHKLLEDLEYARDIQKAMLPLELPNSDFVSFSARYYEAERVSGDFYNVFKLDEKWIGIYIGDVSGHGVPAAMLTVFLNQSIKTAMEQGDNRFEAMKPSHVLKNLFDDYNRLNFKDEMYALMFYAIYNIDSKEMVYSSAGLNTYPIVLRGNGSLDIEGDGFPICNLKEVYTYEYTDNMIKLQGNDKVLFYTDGLVELRNQKNGETFGEDNLKKLISSQMSGQEIMCRIDREITRFSDEKNLRDDITYILMEVK